MAQFFEISLLIARFRKDISISIRNHRVSVLCPYSELDNIQMQKKKDDLEIRIQLIGWILFIICALLFMAASLKNQDFLTFAGSLIFLVAHTQ